MYIFCVSVSHMSEIDIHDNNGQAATTLSQHNDKKHKEVHKGMLVQLMLICKKIIVLRLTVYSLLLYIVEDNFHESHDHKPPTLSEHEHIKEEEGEPTCRESIIRS